MKLVIDKAVAKDDFTIYAVVFFLIVLSSIIIKLIYNVFRNRFSLKIEVEMKKNIYLSVLHKSLNDLSKYHSGEISNIYINDIRNIDEAETNSIPNLFLYWTRFLFAVILLIFVDVWFLLILFCLGVLMFGFHFFFGKKLKRIHKKSLESDGELNGFMSESLENIKIIKANDSYDNLYKSLDKRIDENYRIKAKRNRFSVVTQTGLFSVVNICYMIAIIYGAFGIKEGVLTYGSFILLFQLVSYIESPFTMLGSSISRIYAYRASKERINSIISISPEMDPIKPFSFECLDIENISFGYSSMLYENLSFKINKGDVVSIKGPSGIGKTTLFNLLLGFISPIKGKIYFNNDETLETSALTRRMFSYVPQENILFSGSIMDNIKLLTHDASMDDIINALKLSDVYDELMERPNGLDDVINERGQGLSLGQIQRIYIAIAIINDCEIMLLDEFSSQLDIKREEKIIKNLLDLGKTIIMINHRVINVEARTLYVGDDYE